MATSPLQIPEILALVLSHLPAPLSSPASSHLASLRLLLSLTRVSQLWRTIILFPPLSDHLFLTPFFPSGRSWAVPASAPWRRLKAEIEAHLGSPIPRPAVAEGEPLPWRLEDPNGVRDAGDDVRRARPLLNPVLTDLGLRITPPYAASQPEWFEAQIVFTRASWEELRVKGGEEASWRAMQIAAPPVTEIWSKGQGVNTHAGAFKVQDVWGQGSVYGVLRDTKGITVGQLLPFVGKAFELDFVEELLLCSQQKFCAVFVYDSSDE